MIVAINLHNGENEMRDWRPPASVVFVHGRAVSPFIKLETQGGGRAWPQGYRIGILKGIERDEEYLKTVLYPNVKFNISYESRC